MRISPQQALTRAVENLARRQAPRGSWPSDYGGPMFLLPMYVALAYAAHRLPSEERRQEMIRYFFNVQLSDGSIGLHAEAKEGSALSSVLGYVALRLLGVPPTEPKAQRLLQWVIAHGGPLGAASWGKFTLCLLGLYDWRGIVPLLPELWLLPHDAPMHPRRLWCHARMVYLPMAWLYGAKSVVPNDALLASLRAELYPQGYASIDWSAQRERVDASDAYRPNTAVLTQVNRVQGVLERLPALLRRKAMAECLKLIRHEDASTNDLDIGPVNAVLNMFVHHFRGAEGAADFERGWPKFDDAYLWQGHDGLKMQGYNSAELWDSAFAMRALLAAEKAGVSKTITQPVLERAHQFLDRNQLRDDVPEAARHYRHPSRGGWPFSDAKHGWPITDCTAEGLVCALALEGNVPSSIEPDRLRDAVRLLLTWQNDDGGWATYERQRGGNWLEALNPSQVFGDIMVDSSYVECTSAVLQALAKAQARFHGEFELSSVISRGVAFLRAQQRNDGSFEGSWAVCFTYGTWFAISGLLAAGVPASDAAIVRAVAFLLSKQRPDGSWAEHGDSCRLRKWVDGETGHAAQTAWALSALVRAGCRDTEATQRAAHWLISCQREDGAWAREAMVGVFNRTCLINYDCYRHTFPLWALAEWTVGSKSSRAAVTSLAAHFDRLA